MKNKNKTAHRSGEADFIPFGKKTLRVKITSCDLKTAWYYEHVGDVFDVVNGGTKDYILADDYRQGDKAMWRHILKTDCQMVVL